MLSITPYEDRDHILPYCKKMKKPYSAGLYLYQAVDQGEVLAAALFEIGGNQVQVLYYEGADPDDGFLFDAVLRAGLNYAAEHGIAQGCIPENFRHTHNNLFSKINFPIQLSFGIENFFNKYKNCNMAFAQAAEED